MLNVLRMEWYRMFKSKGTWITLLVFTAMFSLMTGMTTLIMGDSAAAKEFQQFLGIESVTADMVNEAGDIRVEMDPSLLENQHEAVSLTEEMALYFQNDGFVLFSAIFMGIFATGHCVTGFRKNLAGIARPWQLVVSDLVMSLTYCTIMTVIGTLLYFLFMALTYEHLVLGSVGRMLVYLVIYTLLTTSIGMLGSLLATLSRSRVLAITAPLVWLCVLSMLVYNLINLAVESRMNLEDFNIYRYMPYGNICFILAPASPAEGFVRAAASGFVLIAVCMGLSFAVSRKQDIK